MIKKIVSNIISIALGLWLAVLFVPGIQISLAFVETILIIWILNIIISKIIKADKK